jgi:diguanylate cyclase (GGDEF)-like protein/PAS domain S-box-containing protein
VFRVSATALGQIDWRLVLFASLLSAGAAFKALHTLGRARESSGSARAGWLVLAGAVGAVGTWATHFLAIRAYEWGAPTAYDPALVMLSLVAGASVMAAGFALAVPDGRWQAAAGGTVVGVGVVLVHFIGLKALALPGVLHPNRFVLVPANVFTVALAGAALVSYREFGHRRALWAASSLMALTLCGLHFVAVGTTDISLDATIGPYPGSIGGTAFLLVIACTTAFIMASAKVVSLTAAQYSLAAERNLRRRHDLLQQREEELREQYQRFETALMSLPHGLSVVDGQRRLVVSNKRFADMYGIPPDLAKPGTPIADLVEHRIATGTYASHDAEAFRQEAASPVTKSTVRTRYLNGGRVVLVTRRPMPQGGWMAVHEDITERRRLQEAERETKETLAAVFDAVPAAIICVAIDRRVLLWSRGAEHIFGYAADESVGQPYKLVPPDSKLEFEDLFGRALAGETLRDIHLKCRRKDGSLVDINFSCAPMRDRDGEVRGIVCALDDLTERERLAARLEAQNELLKQSKKELKDQNEQLDAALANMVQGLAMFDSEERLILANARYAELFGLEPEEIPPGIRLREIVELRAAKGLYPGSSVDDVLAALRAQIARGISTHQVSPGGGRLLTASVRPRAEGGWVVTLDDISGHERLKKQLEARNEQLDVALNNMTQGLAMFDSDMRIVVANNRYAEMYGLTADQVRPGMTVRQTLEQRLAKGVYEDPAIVDVLVERFGQRASDIHRLADGRSIHVTYRRTPSGGHVVTHEDITARERLNTQLEQQHRLLKEQEEKLKAKNVQLDAALNNMAQGLAMFDSDMRIVVANDRYAEIYNLSPDEVKPGTHLRDILARRMANGDLDGKDPDTVMRWVLSRMSATGESQYTTRLNDGRYIVVSSKPMVNGYTVTTHQDITEQRRSEAKIVHMALHDALTGLPNRVLFNQRLELALSRARRGDIVAAHLLDLDHFKNVNDTLGHPSGDQLLKLVTERLRRLVRETDTIARMGGDEFAILQVGVPQVADAAALARRIIDTVSEPYEIDSQQVVIGTSVGIAIGPGDGGTPDQLMRNADLALYRAKGDGRGAFCFFEAGMDAKVRERRAMEYDLRKALVAGEFELFYQPMVNLESNKISGFEALIRWRHPERGLVSPAAFISLAEEIGFINPLGDWAIRQACATAARWPADVKVAVNLSPVQFRGAGLVQTVVNALAASGLPAQRLELEITESTLLQDSEATLAMLYQLREVGVSIAMDDFGTGYSSLSYLQSFPFDRIKIDRSFIKDITDGVGSLNIVRAVAALARGLGMETTAEGVETEQQREKVAAEGCTEMQGFLFSRPRPAREIEELYFPQLQAERSSERETDAASTPIAARAGVR